MRSNLGRNMKNKRKRELVKRNNKNNLHPKLNQWCKILSIMMTTFPETRLMRRICSMLNSGISTQETVSYKLISSGCQSLIHRFIDSKKWSIYQGSIFCAISEFFSLSCIYCIYCKKEKKMIGHRHLFIRKVLHWIKKHWRSLRAMESLKSLSDFVFTCLCTG